MNRAQTILGIESSCDDTAAAIYADGKVRANVVSSQLLHAAHGGVIPELASRLHQSHIARVVEKALTDANLSVADLTAVAYTQGPGLLGALHVGTSYAKAFASARGLPAVPVDHLQGHRLSLLLADPPAQFPFLCLTVSGGHTQLDVVTDPLSAETLGRTRDDAAGECFDKCALQLGIPYPGGPALDQLAEDGAPGTHPLPAPAIEGFDFSYSGLKTALLYYLEKQPAGFVETHRADLAASLRAVIVDSLLTKLEAAATETGVQHIGIAGGVSANRLLRRAFQALCERLGVQGHLPPLAYCTDNAAMIAVAGAAKLAAGFVPDPYAVPFATQR